jgi:WD40 repeat protein
LEGGNALTMASGSPALVEAGRQHKIWLAMGVAVMLVLMAAVGYGVYSFLSHKGAMPYENFTISQITNTGKAIAAAISPDGKFLLTVVDDHGKQSLWLRNISTNSEAQVIPSEDARYLDPAFSPDGNYIYFRKDVSYIEAIDMLRSPVLGSSPQVIVHDVDTAFTFSPEGKRMAYVRNNPEIGKFQVLMANAEGTDEKMLSGGLSSASPSAIAWSPDGKQIASAIPWFGRRAWQNSATGCYFRENGDTWPVQ